MCIFYTCYAGILLNRGGVNILVGIQAACVPAILSGDDVVVAAETGSGKTHGYLVPIIHKVYSNLDALHDPKLKRHQHVSLVLCPNVMLCEQVVRMANSLLDGAGEPLLKAAAVCGRQVHGGCGKQFLLCSIWPPDAY